MYRRVVRVQLLVAIIIAADNNISSSPSSSNAAAGPGTQSLAQDKNRTLYLLSFLPYPTDDDVEAERESARNGAVNTQPVWNEGPSVYLAAKLAVELINNNPDILPGYTLELIQGRGGCNVVSRTSIGFTKYLFNNGGKKVLGILGPGCSASGLFVSKVTGTNESEISLLSVHLGTSPIFSQSAFPYSFSMLAHTSTVAMAIAELMKTNKWRNVIVLYDESQVYFTNLLEYLERTLKIGAANTGIPVASLIYENYIPFNDIKLSQKRIILLLVGSSLFSRILCVSFRNGLIYPTYQWMIVGAVFEDLRSVHTVYEGELLSCQLEELLEFGKQSIFILDHFEPLNATKHTDSGLTHEQFMHKYKGLISNHTNSSLRPSFWGTVYFDATWAMALALNNSIEVLKSHNVELSEFEYGQNQFTDIIRQQLLQLSFEGISGMIRFNGTTGFVSRGVDIEQVQQRQLQRVMHFNGTRLLQSTAAKQETIEDNFDNFGEFSEVPIWVTVLILMSTAFILVLLATLYCGNIVHRHAPSVKASSLKIIHLTYIGCYLTTVGILCESIAAFLSSQPVKKCHLEQASFSIEFFGMTLIFATICVRTWRLYRIFVHYIHPGMFVSDKALFVFIFICLILELPVILAWCIADPIKPTVIRNFDLQLRRIYCTSGRFYIWALSLLAYNAVLLLISCYFALRCNKISQKDFKSNSILNLAYILTIELTIGICIHVLFPRTYDPQPEYLTKNVTLLVYVFSCCVLLFLPPLLPLLKHNPRRQSKRSSTLLKLIM